MKLDFTLKDVQDVYDGPGGLLWEMCMTEQIHSGGAATTEVLANALDLNPGSTCSTSAARSAPRPDTSPASSASRSPAWI